MLIISNTDERTKQPLMNLFMMFIPGILLAQRPDIRIRLMY